MRRSLNVKMLAILLGVCAALGTGAHLLHGYQAKRNARALLRQAEKAKEDGQLEQAADYYKRYLGFEPRDNEALAEYAQTAAELSRKARSARAAFDAFSAYGKLLAREPERAAERREFVRVAMSLGRYVEARESLAVLKDEGKPKTDELGELYELTAQCYQGEKKYLEAAKAYEEALKRRYNEVANARELARLYRLHLNQRDQAAKVLDKLVANNDKSVKALLERVAFYREFARPGDNEWERVEADLAQAEALEPREPEVLLAGAEVALKQLQPDKALDFSTHLLKAWPKDPRPYRLLAQAELMARRPEQALERLRQGLKEMPGNAELRWILGNFLLDLGRPDEAEKEVNAISPGGLPEPWVELLRARLLASRAEWAKAAEATERLLPQLEQAPDRLVQALLLLGRCQDHLENAERMLEAYNGALNRDPRLDEAVAGRAKALLKLGKADGAIDALRRLEKRTPQANVELAGLLIRQNLALPPNRRDWQEINALLDEAAKDNPDVLDVALLRAGALAARGEVEAARAVLDKARTKHPDKAEPWIALSNLEERRDKPEEALRVLARAEKALGDRVDLRLARVAYWVRRGGDAARPELAKLEAGADKFMPEERQRLWNGLALAHTQLGDNADAVRLWKGLAGQRRDALGVRLFLFDLALQAGDEGEIDRAVKDLKALEGENGTYWRYATACHYLWQVERRGRTALNARDKETLAAARDYLAQAGKRRRGWSRVTLAEARIDDLLGSSDKALEGYLKAIDLGERGPDVINRALQLLVARRRYEEANRILRQLPEEALLQGMVTREAAEVLWQQKNTALAYKAAEASVPATSTDYRDHLWRGQIFKVLGKPDKAEESFRKAVELAPDNADAWAPLIQFLALTDKDKAAEELKKAEKRVPRELARLAFAACYEALGQADQSEALLKAALAAQPDDPAALRNYAAFLLRAGRAKDAVPQLRKLGEFRAKAPADAEWALGVLALVLASDSDWKNAREALNVVAELEKTQGTGPNGAGPVALQRLKALVLAMQKGRDDRKKAIDLLEREIGRPASQPLTAEEKLLLAQLYESTGDWSKARTWLADVLAEQPENPRYLAELAAGLIRANEIDGVPPLLAKLEKLQPKELRTLEIKVRLLKARQKDQEAVAALEDYARTEGARIDFVAALLDELDRPEAEKYYRLRVEREKAQTPEVVLALADFLGRQKRTQEALDLCEGAWRTCPPESVARTCAHVLHVGKPDAEQLRRVERWLKDALQQKGANAVPLQWYLAAVYSQAGRFDETEALYRRIIEQDPRNGLAMNNLAFVLALRAGKAAEALTWINKAIEIVGEVPDVLDTRGIVYLKLNEPVKAIKDLRDAVAEMPTASKYFHLTQAYLANRQRSEAAETLRKANQQKLGTSSLHPLEEKDYQNVLRELGKL